MSEALNLQHGDRVLEIGTGSGYQTAILAELVRKVYTIEIVQELGERSKTLLRDLSYENADIRIGNGHEGWNEKSPFDAIIVTAVPPTVPQSLLNQLKVGGRNHSLGRDETASSDHSSHGKWVRTRKLSARRLCSNDGKAKKKEKPD